MKTPIIVKKLVLLIFSTCFALLVCEFVIRYRIEAWPFESAPYVPDYLTTRDTTLRWRFSSAGGRNSLGLRNRELGPKQTGTYRVLFLGDSLVWSGETSSDELYTAVLERQLNSLSPNDSNSFEIVNAGIPGYTTYQELEFLKIYGIDMQPDLVILGFALNDVYYKYLHKPTKQKLLGPEPTSHLHRFDPSAFPGSLFARSYLAHECVLGCEVIWKRILQRPMFPFERERDVCLAWKSYGWTYPQKLIGEMQALLAEREIPIAVVVFPLRSQMDDRYRKIDKTYVLYPQRRIREICEGYTIPMLDLAGPLYKNGGISLFRDFLHLNAKGNDVVADELERFLIDKLGLLDAVEQTEGN